MKSIILHIETTSLFCSVAISKGDEIIASAIEKEKNSHAVSLSVLIERVMENTGYQTIDLSAIAISKGPGSYTGLRIGTSVAKGLCYALDIPLIAINTLQAMANGMKNNYINNNNSSIELKEKLFYPLIDARRNEVYSAVLDDNINFVRETQAEIIDKKDDFNIDKSKDVIVFGNGADKLKDIIDKNKRFRYFRGFDIKAENMVSLATDAFNNKKFEDVAYFEPFYLKDFVAIKPKKSILKR